MQTWAKESIDLTNMFAHSLSTHAAVSNILSKFASYSKLHHKSTTHSMSTTRFIEYGHRHIRNMKVLSDDIPNIIKKRNFRSKY